MVTDAPWGFRDGRTWVGATDAFVASKTYRWEGEVAHWMSFPAFPRVVVVEEGHVEPVVLLGLGLVPSSPSTMMAPISKLTLHEAVPYWYLYTNQFHELHFGKLQTQRISWIVFHIKTIKILISFPSLKCLPSSLPAWAVWRTWQTCWRSHWCTLEAGSRNFGATGTAQSSLGHIQILFKVS